MTTSPILARLALPTLAALFLIGPAPRVARAEPQQPGKATLRWKFKEGEVLRYQTIQTTTSKIKDPEGKEITQTLTLTIDLNWNVKAVDASSGSATMAMVIDRIRTTATLPFGKFSFDSKEAGDASGPAGPIFKMLVGSETTFKMNPRGEIAEIKLADKITETLKGDEPAGAQGQFSEVGLKNMLAQMGLAFPEAPVEVGGTWERKIAIPAGPDGQTRDVAQRFTYRGPDATSKGDPEAVDLVSLSSPLKPDPNVPITIKKEDGRGRFLFDNVAGRIASSGFTQSVELTGQVDGKEVAQSTETVTTMTLSADKAP